MDSQQPISPHALLVDAVIYAETRADLTGLPQTVYRAVSQQGWWYARADAPFLMNTEVYLTVLPSAYFG